MTNEPTNQYVYKVYVPVGFYYKSVKYFKDYFDGFTIYEGFGVWKKQAEKVDIFEVIAGKYAESIIRNFCFYVKKELKQETVFYTKQPIEGNLI